MHRDLGTLERLVFLQVLFTLLLTGEVLFPSLSIVSVDKSSSI